MELALIDHNRYARDFVVITLEPFIQDMEERRRGKLAQIPVHNLFRQVECWRYDFSSLPRRSFLGYDPGMPEEETKEVYVVMDTAFQQVFPDLLGYSREEAAKLVESVIGSVSRELFKGESAVPGHREQLIAFAKKIVEGLKNKAPEQGIPATSESAA